MAASTFNFRFLIQLFRQALNSWLDDNAMRLSAALSYYAIFSIAPLLLIATGIVGWIYGPEARSGVVSLQLQQMLGREAATAVQTLVQNASEHSGGATVLGFAVLVVGASTVFGQLKDSLDTLWEVKTKPGLNIANLVRERLLLFGMVLAVGFLLLVSLAATTAITAASGWIERHWGIPSTLNHLLVTGLSLTVETLLFMMIYKVLPSAEIDWRSTVVGAVSTAVLFEVGKFGLSQYLARGSVTSSFGAAGSVVLILVWVFYASCIFFFGASLTKEYAHAMGKTIKPAWNAISTRMVCSQGQPVSESYAQHGPIPAEAHPLSPLPPPPKPERETLVPLLRAAYGPQPRLGGPRLPPATLSEHAGGWWERLNARPFSAVGTALGFGLLAGLASRLLDRRS